MSLYRQRRVILLEQNPGVGWLLPEDEPPAPDVPRLAPNELARLVRPAAATHADLVLVCGWGDGSVVRALADDALCRQKRLHVLIYGGEEAAVAHALGMNELDLGRFAIPPQLSFIPDRASVQRMILAVYLGMSEIPVIAGLDIIDGHPLIPAAQALRQELHAELLTQLGDRPQVYGNDIGDSFTGLFQASKNAPQLLPAPTLDEMGGFFGNTPVISIAAGPSLKRRLPQLRALQDRCILVACDAVLHGLMDEGVDPHFVTPLERVEMINPMLTRAGDSRSIYAGLPVCPPESVRRFGDARSIGLYCGDRLYDWLLPNPGKRVNTGLSTGTLSVSMAVLLGTGPVYLVGHDLARDESGSHWGGAAYAGSDWARVKKQSAGAASRLSGYDDRLVPGNDGGFVESIAWWDRFRHDIAYEALQMKGSGRTIYNPNAHDRIFASIDHTEAAPLPDPASLPVLAPWRLPERKPERLVQWRARARNLASDAVAFRRHIATLRDDIATARTRPPARWDVEGLSARLDLSAAVTEGNRSAFAYILRSALYNSTAEMHLRRRTASWARSRWRMLETMDGLCHALDNALGTLMPKCEEIARDCA